MLSKVNLDCRDMSFSTESQNVAAAVKAHLHDRSRLPPPEIRRALRIAGGLTTGDVARLVGVTRQAVSKWERGLCTPSSPHIDHYVAVLTELDRNRRGDT